MNEKEVKSNNASAVDETEEKREEFKNQAKALLEERVQRAKEANEAMKEGKGRLKLETPIKAGGENIEELPYDFTALTGLEYIDAMDSDGSAQNTYRVTYMQSLALFARAAAKEVDALDMKDIIERIGGTDAVTAIQLASGFFASSTRAGHLRISKK